METTELRDVPIAASRIGLGTWAMGGVQWGGADDDASVRTIHAAIDRGVNLIAHAVRNPVGSEFMAPPESAPEAQPAAPA